MKVTFTLYWATAGAFAEPDHSRAFGSPSIQLRRLRRESVHEVNIRDHCVNAAVVVKCRNLFDSIGDERVEAAGNTELDLDGGVDVRCSAVRMQP